MTTESRLFNLGNIERFLFRPLFVFFTFVMVLLALFQGGGRLSMQALHHFEDELNSVLALRQISVQGLQGDWRGLNPVLRADALQFPAGGVQDVEVELDLLESIFRNAPITHLVRAGNVSLHAQQTDDGWRLQGMAEQPIDFDFKPLLRHSDDMSGHVQLHFAGAGGGTATIEAELALINRGGVHYAGVDLLHPDDDQVQLELRMWQRDEVLFVQQPANAGYIKGELAVPEILSGMQGLALRFQDTYWQDEDEQGGGMLALDVTGIRLPASEDELLVQLGLTAQRDRQQLRALSSEVQITSADDQLKIGPLYIDAKLPEPAPSQLVAAAELLVRAAPDPMVKVWLEHLQLGQISGFFLRHLSGWEPAASWVRALAVNGEAYNVHGYYDPDLGAGVQASIADLNMQGYKGAPTLTNVQGRIWGYGQGMAVQVNSRDVSMQFPDLFHDSWALDSVQGVVKAWFGNGYFGMRGSHLKGRMDSTQVAAGFAITRPPEKRETRLSLQVGVDEVDVMRARTFVPFKIPAGFAGWLERGPRGGTLAELQFALHGQTLVLPGELGRRIELTGRINDGHLEYAQGWPEVTAVTGEIHVAGVDTRIRASSAHSGEVKLSGADIVLHDNARFAAGTIETTGTDAAAALEFIRSSPLAEMMSFITPGWAADGALNLHGNLRIPISVEQAPPLRVDLQFYLDGFDLDMPDYRVAVADLRGSGTYSLPHNLKGRFSGNMFEQPATFAADFDEEWVRFDIAGSATPEDVYELLDSEYEVPVQGQFNFDSELSLAMGDGVTNLAMDTDLAGLQIDLPGVFAKDAADATPSELEVQFLSSYQTVSWRYRDVSGWLHYGDDIERGALGVGVPPPMTAQDEKAMVVAGHMAELVLGNWISGSGEDAIVLPFDWKIQDLRVDRFMIEEVAFADMILSGAQRGEDMKFDFAGPELTGKVDIPADGVIDLAIEYVRIEDPDAGYEAHIGAPQEDPLSVEVGASLPAANVSIAQLDVGDEPFGAWRFVLEPQEQRVVFKPFAADVNGVHIADSTVTWDLARNVSSFKGSINLDDLQETLPKWDYAPSVTTDRASVVADLSWPGSPVNVSVMQTDGEFEFKARDGRFIEVESGSGGLRILGLLNFTKLAQRINFDISDVVGEGIGFDKVDAKVALNSGHLTFPERMTIDSSSGDYQVGGRVNLHTGELDNEMIVTLPVSKSLPWYGVYLALANPLVGLGVVVGERVLRKPIEQFSTAKFEVTGTLDDPEVNFVSLWDRSMKEPVFAGDPSLLESSP